MLRPGWAGRFLARVALSCARGAAGCARASRVAGTRGVRCAAGAGGAHLQARPCWAPSPGGMPRTSSPPPATAGLVSSGSPSSRSIPCSCASFRRGCALAPSRAAKTRAPWSPLCCCRMQRSWPRRYCCSISARPFCAFVATAHAGRTRPPCSFCVSPASVFFSTAYSRRACRQRVRRHAPAAARPRVGRRRSARGWQRAARKRHA